MNLTDAIELNFAGGRWESKRDAGIWTSQGKLDIGWRRHPWLRLLGGWNGIGTGDEAAAVHVSFTMPLGEGGRSSSLRWKGLGVRDPSSVAFDDTGAMWAATQHINEIAVVERKKPTSEADDSQAHDGVNLSDQYPVGE